MGPPHTVKVLLVTITMVWHKMGLAWLSSQSKTIITMSVNVICIPLTGHTLSFSCPSMSCYRPVRFFIVQMGRLGCLGSTVRVQGSLAGPGVSLQYSPGWAPQVWHINHNKHTVPSGLGPATNWAVMSLAGSVCWLSGWPGSVWLSGCLHKVNVRLAVHNRLVRSWATITVIPQ